MNIPGLHHEIATLRSQAAAKARTARAPATDPRIAHEAAESADQLSARAEMLVDHLKSDAELLEGIQQLRCYLAASKHDSRGRQDVMTYLNAAAGVLLLEIGTPEAVRDFKPLPTAKPINGKKKS